LTTGRNIITCEAHDYFEAACVHHYQLELELFKGPCLVGVANDIKTTNQTEYLLLVQQDSILEVNLLEIKKVQVLTPNAVFDYFDVRGK
jgi:Rho-binding antiterminator